MSIPLGKRISICDKEFSDYRDLAKHMRFLVGEYVKGTHTVDSKHLTKSLKAFKASLIFGQHRETYKYLMKENFEKVCIELMKLCMGTQDMTLLSALLSCFITITDNSKEMTEVLLRNGLTELVIEQTIDISKRKVSDKVTKNLTVEGLIEQLIQLVNNIVCDARFQECFINSRSIAGYKKAITPNMESKSHRIRILTMGVLTWLIEDDEDKTNLWFYSKIIDYYVEYINRALADKLRRCEGLTISEMLLVLKSLSNVESIKNTMLRMKKLTSLMQTILKSDKSTNEEIQIALRVIINLSIRDFSDNDDDDDDRKTDINFQCVRDMDVVVKPFVNSSEPLIRKYANGVISELNSKITRRKTEILYDIFISHCKSDEEIVQRISETLTKRGYRVWKARENIKGYDDEDIKESIEQARILLIGVSNSYYNNECCHAECKHAYDLKKPLVPIIIEPKYKPKDWLRKMIDNETKVDFSSENEFDSFTETLMRRIEGMVERVEVMRPQRPELSAKMKSLNVGRSCLEEKEIKLWSKEDVSKWLSLNGLSHLEKNLAKFDGKMLDYLKKMSDNSREQYSRRLKEDLNLSFEDEIAFDEALENLKW